MEKIFSGHSKSSGIYQILNKINNKRYFGQAKQLASRAYQHETALKSNRHSNKHLQNAWNEYGSEAFEFSVLAVIDDPEKRTIAEQKLIDAFYGEDCYNIEKKAQLMPEDVIEKMCKAQKGKTHSEATKQKIGAANRSKPSAKKGKPLSEQTKQKIRNAHVGNKGKTHSEATKQKMREAHLGRTPPNEGKPHSEAAREKMKEAWKLRKQKKENKEYETNE